MWILLSVALGFLLDLCFGDPVWLPHPVVLIGKSISRLEKFLRQKFPQTPAGETKAGVILAVCIPLCSLLLSGGILLLAYHISFWLWFVLHTFWSYQILAARCLEKESRKVYRFLAAGDLSGARTQLSYLVGRETSQLSAEEVTKACVETVAENTSDGVTAPLFYLLLGGVPLGFCYKAINTLDSMVGYRNAKYLFFGRASAKTDDAANFQHILRDGLQSGDVDDHHIAHLLPAHQDDQSPKAEPGLQHHGGIVLHQNTVEDHGPDIAQHDAADQVGHEEHRAEQVRALDALGQEIGHRESQHVDKQHRHEGKQRCIPEGMDKAAVRERLHVVVKTHPFPLAGQLELTEGQERALQERVQKPDAKGGEGGQQEQPYHPLDRPADQAAAQCRRVVLSV